MEVRNINQGDYQLPLIPTSLTFTGAVTVTLNDSFSMVQGTIKLYIPQFIETATATSYLTTQIPPQFIPPALDLIIFFNVLVLYGSLTTPGVFTLNTATGELRLIPDPLLVKTWIPGQTCGLWGNATLVWNLTH